MEWISVKDRLPDKGWKNRKRGEPIMPLRCRLFTRAKVNEKSGCWEWTGYKRNGYGRMIVGSRQDGTRGVISTHRLSYLLTNGDIPSGMEVCHKCDNPACINPDHLFVGTRQDNVDDREKKNRNVVLTGEEKPESKLSKKIVKDARWERTMYGTSFQKLADKYGVSKKTMMNAIKGITWKCVTYCPVPPTSPPPPEVTP